MELYLDNAASMPMSNKTIDAVSKASKTYYANPFSVHSKGREALKALTEAKKRLAAELGVKAEEIVLTSGGTESNALAIIGIARAKKKEIKNKILISSIEHSSVHENAINLQKEGFMIKEIPASDRRGLDLQMLEKEIDGSVAIVSIMSVNSDTGMLNDIPKIAKICRSKNAVLHVDHSQGFGKIALQPKSIGADLVTADAHKIGGPKGIGLLYVRAGLSIEPLFKGGEKGRIVRAGTENVPAAIGFAAALEECKRVNWKQVEASRNALQSALEEIGAKVTAKDLPRAPTHLHVCFENANGEAIVNYLSTRGIYCSTGSACDSEKEGKRVLSGLGLSKECSQGALRFSLAKPISIKDVRRVAKEIERFIRGTFKKTVSS